MKQSAKRKKRATDILLALNVQITNFALEDTRIERGRDLTPGDKERMRRSVDAKAQLLFQTTTDMIGGSRLTSRFLPEHQGGTGEIGDFAIFCVYVSRVIRQCAEHLESVAKHGSFRIKAAEEYLSLTPDEVKTGLDTTLATSLTRAKWVLKERRKDLSEYLERLLISAIDHIARQDIGPIAAKTLASLKSDPDIARALAASQKVH